MATEIEVKEKYPPEQCDACEAAMLRVASACDGAKKLDCVGFNGRDAHSDFVQSLVRHLRDRRRFSPKQMAWALKIMRKYRRQIGEDKYRLMYPEEFLPKQELTWEEQVYIEQADAAAAIEAETARAARALEEIVETTREALEEMVPW